MTRLPLLLTLLAAALLGWWANLTPRPLPADAPAMAFSATRAMADVRVIAARPHPTGSPANAQVRAHLLGRLQQLGFTVRQAEVPLDARSSRRLADWGGDGRARAINIVAIRPGRDQAQPAVAVMAHYDSVWASPGAADDAAGVAAALEIARAIPADSQNRDLVLLITDAEELGLVGARGFFGDFGAPDPLAKRIGHVVNMEARGGGGRAMMFETGNDNGETVRLFADHVRDPAANSLAVAIYKRLPNGTDFTASKNLGVQGLNFAFIGDPQYYHSPLITPDRLDQGALQHMGAQALDATRALVTAPALPRSAPDAVFGDFLGLFTIVYPPVTGWAIIGVAIVLLCVAGWRGRDAWRVFGIIIAMGEALLTLALAVGLVTGLNWLSIAGKPEYYDRMAALPRLEAMVTLSLLGVLALVVGGIRRRPLNRWFAWAKLTALAALAQQWLLPGGGPLFAWPLLAVALAMALAVRPGQPPRIGPVAVLAVPALAWLGGLAHFVLLGVGATMPAAAVLLMLPAMALVAPLVPDAPRRPALLVAGLLVAGALGLSLWVRLDGVAPSVPPYAGTEKN